MPAEPGTRIGPYQIISLLGSGGMGEVYRARDERLHRDVAVKVIAPRFAADSERLRRFQKEALAAASLNHPHIVAVYDVGSHDGAPYLVTELIEGESLRDRLLAGPLPIHKSVQFGVQIAHGVAAAHEGGVLHRDLKPENVLVGRHDQLKIVDFGLAKLVDLQPASGETRLTTVGAATEHGLMIGTVGYMAPEQARGEPADQRSDIFAIGAILYEMLTGRRAFHADTAAETLTAILREHPPPIRTLNRAVGPALALLVAHCLEKQARQRFQTARDLAFALETIGAAQDADAETASGSATVPGWPAWRRVAVGVGAAALLGVGFMLSGLVTPVEPTGGEIRVHRLTDSRGLEEFPAISPDGKSVAFVAQVDGEAQIFVRLVAGGMPLQITRDAGDHLYPRWSHDSASLFYYRLPGTGEATGAIWEVPALGGGPRRIVSSAGGADISHDGQRLVFPRQVGRRMQLAISARDGSDPAPLADLDPAYYYLSPRWSFDDRLIAYVRGHTNTFEIFIVPVQGGEPRQLTQQGARLDGLAWAPDGTNIIFSSSQGSTSWYLPTTNLWRLAADGSRLQQLTFGEVSYVYPDTNASGMVVVQRVRRDFDLWRYAIDQSPVDNVRSAVRLTRQTSAIHTPSVSPDGTEIVFVSDSGSHANLWVMNLQNGQSRRITSETDPRSRVGLPLWSPDGAQIAYFKSSGPSWDYFLVRPDGSEPRPLARNAAWATWSPDGQWLYYSDYPAGTHLRRVSVTGGDPEIVRSDSATRVAIAPDGGSLYYAIELPGLSGGADLEIRVARPENGDSRVLARMPAARAGSGGGFQPVISPDGKWLALALLDGITTNLWAMSTSTGELRQLADFGDRPTIITRRVSWSADGRFIIAAVGEADSDVVLLENLK